MTGEEYELLGEFITERMGMTFPGARRELLEARLLRRLDELRLASFMDYYLLLLHGGDGELTHLARTITNNETYFFRETLQFDALVGPALPDLLKDRQDGAPLRLLSAGCSSGEEVYTLSIWLKENQFRLRGREARVDGFDLDPQRVEMARAAEYGPSSLRALSPEQVQRYFSAAGPERHQLKALYRGGTRFSLGNLLEPADYVQAPGYDVVFCRNVLIYFSEPALRRALAGLARALRKGGLLFLGHSESAVGLLPELEAVRVGNLIAYQKVAR